MALRLCENIKMITKCLKICFSIIRNYLFIGVSMSWLENNENNIGILVVITSSARAYGGECAGLEGWC